MPKQDSYTRLQDILITARREQGLTQVTVAERLNKPQSFVSKYESGERRLDVIEFIEVCEALHVKPWAMMKKLDTSND